MDELRYSNTIAITSFLLCFINILRLYFDGSMLWLFFGLTLISVYLLYSLEDLTLQNFSRNINISKHLQHFIWSAILTLYFISSVMGLLLISDYIYENKYFPIIYPVIILVIMILGTIIGLYQKIHFNISNN